ncbi:hypothetical protein BDZ89DRAFT_1118909 [Hymenopellis radicata]|nr:hypothetical protein BDZ89DRAFT_1118909 [Hymenopellis radicata]
MVDLGQLAGIGRGSLTLLEALISGSALIVKTSSDYGASSMPVKACRHWDDGPAILRRMGNISVVAAFRRLWIHSGVNDDSTTSNSLHHGVRRDVGILNPDKEDSHSLRRMTTPGSSFLSEDIADGVVMQRCDYEGIYDVRRARQTWRVSGGWEIGIIVDFKLEDGA